MRWLEHLEEGLIALLMAAMTLTAFSQVVARYVFNYSFVWALELNTVFFAWLIFLGMSYGVRVGSHIGIDAGFFFAACGAFAGMLLAAILGWLLVPHVMFVSLGVLAAAALPFGIIWLVGVIWHMR